MVARCEVIVTSCTAAYTDSARHIRRLTDERGAAVDINLSQVPLNTVYCFSSMSDYAEEANIVAVECICSLLKIEFMTRYEAY